MDEPPISQDLARDWTTLWQSELAAIAADPEAELAMRSLLEAWLQADAAFDAAAAWPDAAARPASAGAAAGARDAELCAMRERIDALERRLAGQVDGGGPAG